MGLFHTSRFRVLHICDIFDRFCSLKGDGGRQFFSDSSTYERFSFYVLYPFFVLYIYIIYIELFFRYTIHTDVTLTMRMRSPSTDMLWRLYGQSMWHCDSVWLKVDRFQWKFSYLFDFIVEKVPIKNLY